MCRFYCRASGIDAEWLTSLLSQPTDLVVPYLTAVKTYVLNNIDQIGLEARFYVDLANLAGYPGPEDREMKDDPVAWLEAPVESDYSASWWSSKFAESFEAAVRAPRGVVSIREFTVSRWMWVTGGASKFSVAMLDGERVRTKFGAAISLSDDELLRLVFNPEQSEEEIGVFLKPDEPGYKRRLIANVSIGGYIVAAYVRYLLEAAVGLSPPFMRLAPTPVEGLDVIGLLRAGSVAVPLDESSYDYNVTESSWQGFEEFLMSRFPGNDGVDMFCAMRGRVAWRFGPAHGVWRKGMPSGLALTSYLNSWMNYIKQTHLVDSPLHWAAGDDALVFSDMSLREISVAYEGFGAVVNPSKNWRSRTAAEFLKCLYHRGGSTGYPARVFGSLLWAGPERTFDPQAKLMELAELWKQFYDRLGASMDVVVVAADLSAAVRHKVVGFGHVQARWWLHTPRVLGGFGRLPYVEKEFRWERVVERWKVYTGVVVRVPEVAHFAQEVSLSIVKTRLKTRPPRLGEPLRLPPVTSIQEWEARLSGEDNPVRGQFRQMALDTIPLPVVDGVSTRVMSWFANANSLNVLPNLKGRSEHVVPRLLAASYVLVKLVRSWMSVNGVLEVN